MRWFPLMLALACLVTADSAADGPIPPYTATYEAQVLGNTLVASTTLSYESDTARLAMDAHVSGFLRILGRFEFNRETLFLIDGAQVRPVQSRSVQVTPRRERRVETRFDWDSKRAQGHVNHTPFELDIRDGTQDYLSSIYLTMLLLHTSSLDDNVTLTVLERDRLRRYTLQRENGERLQTPFGRLPTVRVTRRDEDRDVELAGWFAPRLGYLPVRLDYEADGTVYQLNLTHLDWHQPLLDLTGSR